MSTKVDIEED